ncbi:Hypothetical predicted protein [Octopus vulgaris]|uniref:Uncharacterized protein n=1 Tax=Octopus vulgaris TaxID=6645 RepID=A0AA36B1G4_OCTVU|nr:Hypothetical predicted protein [Octopus vulgaris]
MYPDIPKHRLRKGLEVHWLFIPVTTHPMRCLLFKEKDHLMMSLSKEERIPDRMMDLSKEERIELVLLSAREGWSYHKIAEEFHLRHPYSKVSSSRGPFRPLSELFNMT